MIRASFLLVRNLATTGLVGFSLLATAYAAILAAGHAPMGIEPASTPESLTLLAGWSAKIALLINLDRAARLMLRHVSLSD